MPWVQDQSGQQVWLDEQRLVSDLQSGQWPDMPGAQVNVVTREGATVSVPFTPDSVQQAIGAGARFKTRAETLQETEQGEYGGVAGQIEAGARGVARVASFGLSDFIGDEERIKKIREYNPWTTMLSEGGTAVLSALAGNWTGGLGLVKGAAGLAKGATVLPRAAIGVAEATGGTLVEGRLAQAAVRGATEGALFGAGQSVSDLALEDPGVQGESIARDMLVNVLGGAIGETAFAGIGKMIAKRFGSAPERVLSAEPDKPTLLGKVVAKMAGRDPDVLASVDTRMAAGAEDFLSDASHVLDNGKMGTLPEKLAELDNKRRITGEASKAQAQVLKRRNMASLVSPDGAEEAAVSTMRLAISSLDALDQMVTAGRGAFDDQSTIRLARDRVANIVKRMNEYFKVTRVENGTPGSSQLEDVVEYIGGDLSDPEVSKRLKLDAFLDADQIKTDIGDAARAVTDHISSLEEFDNATSKRMHSASGSFSRLHKQARDLLENQGLWGDMAIAQAGVNQPITDLMDALGAEVSPRAKLSSRGMLEPGERSAKYQFGKVYRADTRGYRYILESLQANEGHDIIRTTYNTVYERLKRSIPVDEANLRYYGDSMSVAERASIEDHIKYTKEMMSLLSQAKEYGDAARLYKASTRIEEDSPVKALEAFPILGGMAAKFFPVPNPTKYLAAREGVRSISNSIGKTKRVIGARISRLDLPMASFLPFTTGGARMVSDEMRDREYQKAKEYIDQVVQSPEALISALEPTADMLSNGTITNAMLSANNAIGHLAATMPKEISTGGPVAMLRQEGTIVDKRARDEWLSRVAVVRDPSVITKAIRSGTLSASMVDTLRTVYPALYQSMIMAYSVAVQKSRDPLTRSQQAQVSLLLDPTGATMPGQAVAPAPRQRPAARRGLSASKGERISRIITGQKTDSQELESR